MTSKTWVSWGGDQEPEPPDDETPEADDGMPDEAAVVFDTDLERVMARLKGVEGERNQARAALVETLRENEALRQVAEFSNRPLVPPKWLTPKQRTSHARATICALMSDWHFTEYVNPDEMDGFNAFDMVIAEARLERFFEGIVKLSRSYFTGITYDGIVLFSGGDLLSGSIHDLAETNEDTQLGGALRFTELCTAGIKMLADEFGKVHVPWTVGNHGRLTFKERTKRRVRDNLDWLIGRMLLREFDQDERVTFQIPESIDVPVKVYDHRYLLYHGQTGGGGGIGGIFPPIMRLAARKQKRYAFDTLVIGHWHQLVYAPDQALIVNGAGKGYDEFAVVNAFNPERPQQAMWLSTPEHGPSFHAPILVADRKSEGW